ncbi:MAG: sulfatase-like hydrolase/transferase [Pirellulales bacterium]
MPTFLQPTAYSLPPLLPLLLLAAGAVAREPERPPNVLIICADDHAAYVAGTYGNELARTPNIDRLAAGGLRFDRAYCNSPVCTASRQSFLTGRYPRTIGVTQLKTPLPDSEVTLAETYKLAGFDTAAIGKMHFNSNLAHGFDLRIDTPEYRRWLAQQTRPPALSGLEVQPPWRPFKDPARVWLNSAALPVDTVAAQADGTYFAEQAAEFLQSPREKPFLLMVSFYEPHSPYRFPREYRGRHDPASFLVPEPGPEDDDQIPAIFRDLTPAEKQGINAAYYTSVAYMDACVGRVLDALAEAELTEDTLVIYLGDHGYMLGQHGRFEKHCSYEEAVRVPLIFRWPKRIAAGRHTRAFVELVDLVPTIHELCGYDLTPPLQGRSLLPLIDAKTTRHRDHVIVEYAQNDEVMIRDNDWKLVYERGAQRRDDGYDTGRPLVANQFRLYDMYSDRGEMHNVAGDPANAATVKRLTDLLAYHLATTAREPAKVPPLDEPLAVLDYCVQSHDVEPGK